MLQRVPNLFLIFFLTPRWVSDRKALSPEILKIDKEDFL